MSGESELSYLEELLQSEGVPDGGWVGKAGDLFLRVSHPTLKKAAQVCCVPPVLDDPMAWHLINIFSQDGDRDNELSRAFFELKRQPFVVPVGTVEWCIEDWARHRLLQELPRSQQLGVHEEAFKWIDGRVRNRPDVDPWLVEAFLAYHLTPKDEVRGLQRWRELAHQGLGAVGDHNGGQDLNLRYATAELTDDLQELGWVPDECLEPKLFRALYLYQAKMLTDCLPLLREISETEREEWAVGVAKHCLAVLVMQGKAPSKKGVLPARYAEGVLWRALRLLEKASNGVGQKHVRMTLATLLSRQGRYEPGKRLLYENLRRAGSLEQADVQHHIANLVLNEVRHWRRGGEVDRRKLKEAESLLNHAVRSLQGQGKGGETRLVQALNTQSKARAMLSDYDGAAEDARATVDLSRKFGNVVQESYGLNRLGWALVRKASKSQTGNEEAQFDEGIDCFERGAEIARHLKDETGVVHHIRGLAWAYSAQEKFSTAEQVLADALDEIHVAREPGLYAWLVRDLCRVLQRECKDDEADTLRAGARQVLAGVGSSYGLRVIGGRERRAPGRD